MKQIIICTLALMAIVAKPQTASPEFGIYALQDVTGTNTVWASHVPANDIESGKITPYVSKIQGGRANMPAYQSPLHLKDGVGKVQKNFLIFRRGPDGQFDGVLKYGDSGVPVTVINGSHSMSFIEASDDAITIYTIHRNVKAEDGSCLVTVSATKSTPLYVCTWSFAGKARLDVK